MFTLDALDGFCFVLLPRFSSKKMQKWNERGVVGSFPLSLSVMLFYKMSVNHQKAKDEKASQLYAFSVVCFDFTEYASGPNLLFG